VAEEHPCLYPCQQRSTTVEQGIPYRPETASRTKHVRSIRVRLEIARSRRDLVIFNLGHRQQASRLRPGQTSTVRCLLRRQGEASSDDRSKEDRPTSPIRQSRNSIEAWLPTLRTVGSRYLFPSRLHARPLISTRQYARQVHHWVESIGLESASYGTHSMRRTKAAQIYRKTGNLRAVQLLFGRATYCPRTTGRSTHHLPISSSLRRDGRR
jgi:site-specific recombinase XerD